MRAKKQMESSFAEFSICKNGSTYGLVVQVRGERLVEEDQAEVVVVGGVLVRERDGVEIKNLWTATTEGARERLRAILMTAMLASLGLLPAAMSHAIGSETQRPIAVGVVGGTISSALLTLVVLPVSYYWAGAARPWFRRRRAAATGS